MAAEGETAGMVDMKAQGRGKSLAVLGGSAKFMTQQVTAKKSINFYMNSAKGFFTGVVDTEGKKREPATA